MPGRWLLEITHTHHDDVRLYTRAADGGWRERRAGEDVPRAAKEIDYRHAAFFLDVPETASRTAYLRIVSRNSILARLTLWQPEAFHGAVQKETLWYGIYLGIYLALAISHLFFWRWTREAISGWYVLYVTMHGAISWISIGYLQQYSSWPSLTVDTLQAVLLCGAIWVVIRFATLLMDLPRLMPRTSRALLWVGGLVALTCIGLALGVRYGAGMVPAQLFSLLLCVVLIALPLWLWKLGHRPARFFALAFGILLAGIFVRYLTTLGFVETNVVTEHSYQIGSIIHMLLMSSIIIGRYNALKRQLIGAQEDALAAKSAVTRQLETEVMARTRSLVDEITRREALENDLRRALEVEQQARQEQRDFVAMVSHEFRTPLAIINTSAQQLAAALDAPREKSVARCANIRDSVRRMVDLMDEYLSLDRMEGDTTPLRLAVSDVRELLDDVLADWPAASIVPEESNLPASLTCDARLVQIALRNLLANGLRHSPADTPVRLTARGSADGGVVFEVADAGSGIPADEIPLLFQKYFRGRGARNKPGAGLGLYLVERIVRLHGGEITVDSAPGQGSMFRMLIPESGKCPVPDMSAGALMEPLESRLNGAT